jgi:glycosyltransferase involved in cell wall biosynthesis
VQLTTIDSVHLSIIIPAFNEETRIGKSLETILSFLKSQSYSFEVIVVDDGSCDGTRVLIHDRYRNEPCVNPPSTQSVAEIRTDIGFFPGQIART